MTGRPLSTRFLSYCKKCKTALHRGEPACYFPKEKIILCLSCEKQFSEKYPETLDISIFIISQECAAGQF